MGLAPPSPFLVNHFDMHFLFCQYLRLKFQDLRKFLAQIASMAAVYLISMYDIIALCGENFVIQCNVVTHGQKLIL